MADVSLIIPVYNRRAMLLEAVRSALQQSRPPAEILVIDDGSTDGSGQAASTAFGPRVRLFTQTRRGVAAARNRGIIEARHYWLAFLDSDDLWQRQKLEKQLAALEQQPDCRVCHTDELWLRCGRQLNQKKKHQKKGGDLFEYSLPFCRISPSAVVLHREILETVGGFDESLLVAEDYDLWLRLTARYQVLHLSEALTIKRGGHPGQLSQETWGLDRFRLIALEKIAAGPHLTRERQILVWREIAEKYRILAGGAAKRGFDQPAAFFRRRGQAAASRLEELTHECD